MTDVRPGVYTWYQKTKTENIWQAWTLVLEEQWIHGF